MKKHIIVVLILTVTSILGCQKLEIEKDTPACIESLIIDFDKEQSCNDGVNVKKYTFQEETVFIFNPGTCSADMTSEVIKSNCESIGFLGGISGNIIINGEDFSNATFKSITWER